MKFSTFLFLIVDDERTDYGTSEELAILSRFDFDILLMLIFDLISLYGSLPIPLIFFRLGEAYAEDETFGYEPFSSTRLSSINKGGRVDPLTFDFAYRLFLGEECSVANSSFAMRLARVSSKYSGTAPD